MVPALGAYVLFESRGLSLSEYSKVTFSFDLDELKRHAERRAQEQGCSMDERGWRQFEDVWRNAAGKQGFGLTFLIKPATFLT